MSSQPEFRELSPEEMQFINEAVQIGCRVCAFYLDTGDSPKLPDDLDAAYEAWASDQNLEKPRPNDIAYGLGALLGQCLVSELGYDWLMVSDSAGTDFCVRHPTAWQSHPFDFVAKRIHEQEPQGGFFRALYNLLQKREEPE